LHQHTVIIICGPTAVGKTAVAVKLAQLLQTEIVSADSRQCFRELNVGVAKPSQEELAAVHHYFINSHSIHDEVSAAVFEKYALDAVANIFQKRDTAVMVGGTGLYIKAFADGLDEIAIVNPEIRKLVIKDYEEKGLEYLQSELAKNDPAFWAVAERQNRQRLMRALEVLLSTGKSITTFKTGKKATRPFNIVKIGLELPREQLYEQINRRVDMMLEQGLVEEVKSLLRQRNLNALQTVGYRELFDYFDAKVSLKQAIENIKTNTRHYAKRQLTWFKKDQSLTWLNPRTENILHSIIDRIPKTG
jgi:tRNA dimethylallyltransferase